ncbi:MAG: hypothetical protein PVS3B3_30800 [Ktedonobacteraceae bacterium]
MVKYEDEEYLTADEACSILGVTRRTLERYVSTGRIEKYRRGIRNVVFKRVDVENLKRELEDVRPAGKE